MGFLLLFMTVFATKPSSSNSAEIQSSELVELETRSGVTQKFILIKPEKPVASVILFAGGKGNIKAGSLFGQVSINWGRNIFVVRTRKEFAEQGLMVAVIDAPSDRKQGWCLNSWPNWPDKKEQFRMSSDHAQDIKAVALYLKKESNIPVWLVGTSWGTVSATNGAIRIEEGIYGLVLTSSVTRCRDKWRMKKIHPNVILDMELNRITVPTLIVSHKDDKCEVTPPEDAPKIKKGLVNSKDVEVMYFAGGKRAIENKCWGLSAHGFYGIEDEVVSAIADFIKSNSK